MVLWGGAALHWATRNPDRVAGVVMVDGGYPWDYLATVEGDGREEIRRIFRKYRWTMPLTRRLGLAAKMTADQHAEINIELNEIVAVGEPLFDRVTFPMQFIVASGASLGGTEEGHTAMRATLDPVLARNPHIEVSATVSSNHSTVVRKDHLAIATAVHEVAAPGLALVSRLEIVDRREATLETRFFDIGVVVYFLRKVIWTVPDFTIDRYGDQLLNLHGLIQRDGCFIAHAQRFLIEARHP